MVLYDGILLYYISCPRKFKFKGPAWSHSQVLKNRLSFRANIFFLSENTIFWAIRHFIYDFKGGWIRQVCILNKCVSFYTHIYSYGAEYSNSFRLYLHIIYIQLTFELWTNPFILRSRPLRILCTAAVFYLSYYYNIM